MCERVRERVQEKRAVGGWGGTGATQQSMQRCVFVLMFCVRMRACVARRGVRAWRGRGRVGGGGPGIRGPRRRAATAGPAPARPSRLCTPTRAADPRHGVRALQAPSPLCLLPVPLCLLPVPLCLPSVSRCLVHSSTPASVLAEDDGREGTFIRVCVTC
jgi:hypothetical protein